MNEFKQHQFAINPGNAINTFVLPFVFTDKVKEAVESIWKNHNPAEHRLILIDNSSEEFEDRKWLEENSHVYIRSYRNLGPAVAFNLGIEMARTKYVTIFSDDARAINQEWFLDASSRLEARDRKSFNTFDNIKGSIISANSIHPQDILKDEFYNPKYDYNQGEYLELDKNYGSRAKGFGLACAIGSRPSWAKAGLFDEEQYIYSIDGTFAAQAEKNMINCFYGGIVFHYGDQSHKGRLVEEGKYQQTGILDGKVVL